MRGRSSPTGPSPVRSPAPSPPPLAAAAIGSRGHDHGNPRHCDKSNDIECGGSVSGHSEQSVERHMGPGCCWGSLHPFTRGVGLPCADWPDYAVQCHLRRSHLHLDERGRDGSRQWQYRPRLSRHHDGRHNWQLHTWSGRGLQCRFHRSLANGCYRRGIPRSTPPSLRPSRNWYRSRPPCCCWAPVWPGWQRSGAGRATRRSFQAVAGRRRRPTPRRRGAPAYPPAVSACASGKR